MTISKTEICQAFFHLGRLESLVDTYHFKDGIEQRKSFDKSIKAIIDLLLKIRMELKDAN